ncbi:MAG: RNA-binding cell elongation regulator Jag/EloR [Gaiellales bacterium]
MTGLEAEGAGETVGEAKWTALRELERRFPGLDKSRVSFTVLSEGERGLLGVGQVPAQVLARLEEAPRPSVPAAAEEPGSPAAQLRDMLEKVSAALGCPAEIAISEDEETLVGTLSGPRLGLLIGRHGQTIDAVQYIANAIVWRAHEERKAVVVDAAGYRERRRQTLQQLADRVAGQAHRSGEAVALEPMSAPERKVVHMYLQDRAGVETASEGAEPNRYVVIIPATHPRTGSPPASE